MYDNLKTVKFRYTVQDQFIELRLREMSRDPVSLLDYHLLHAS